MALAIRAASEWDIAGFFKPPLGYAALEVLREPNILAVVRNGAVIGLGGAYTRDDGRRWAFYDAKTRRYPIALLKAARAALDGEQEVYAERDDEQLTSERFLTHLGFQFSHRDVYTEQEVWLWAR